MQHLRAEHSALEIDERQQDGAIAEILAERYILARLVTEAIVQGQRRVQSLVDAGILEIVGRLLRRGSQRLLGRVLREAGKCGERGEQDSEQSMAVHCFQDTPEGVGQVSGTLRA